MAKQAPTMTPTDSTAADTSILEKIQRARELFRKWGEELQQDPAIRDLMASLDLRIMASKEAMIQAGIFSACQQCEEDEGGSCCGAGIEDKYDAVLLATNLLMGGTLTDAPYGASDCFFLGPKGCTLKVRHTLCMNYLCLSIQRMLAMEHLISLQNTVGNEMDTTFRLTEAVKRYIRSRTT